MKNIQILLSILCVCIVRSECPPSHYIHPCKCTDMVVRCEGVSSLASVRATLEGHFTQTLTRLYLTNVYSFSLPPYALGSISTKKLVLRDSNIRSVDDNAFEGQSSLSFLVLSDDRLEEIPEKSLRSLTGLQTLSLSGNFLMRIHKGSLSQITSLRFLILSANRISKLDKDAFPKNLETLALSKNLLKTLNGSLHHLNHLEQLFATDNRLTDVKGELEGLKYLRHLSLDRNTISNISDAFLGLESLIGLSLSSNRIQKLGNSLSGLRKLKILNLSGNYLTELNGFEKLKELEILDLSGNYLRNTCFGLKPLRSLRDLNLSDMNLESLEPECFRNMKSLKALDLSRNRMVDVDGLFRYPLPALTYLRLDHNRLAVLTHAWKAVKNLRELDIRFNHLSTLHLVPNKELATLKIAGNPWKCTELLQVTLRDLEQRNVDVQGRPC